ncbi:uncharacterized protein LOC126264810 [Aethina tumida]|uniref:uncharacterized protein LOC126264810 n=1 Tax=Aethina tumida TaxID=116153 RepID=UPI0021478F1D|nr:uncharacterized protein LOC126264810 [Aethina tumida]
MLVIEYRGNGLLNSVIDNLPFELHLPFYQYCGPGTKLKKRLARGDTGINELDKACKRHDIAYEENKSLQDRHKADFVLENEAWNRVKSKNANLGEKAAAWLVTTGMKIKRKLGMGHRTQHQSKISFKKDIVDKIDKKILKSVDIKPGSKSLRKIAAAAIKIAKVNTKRIGGRKNVKIPRTIPFSSKQGGILPLLPILAGLSSLGALMGGAAGVAKTIVDAKNAKKNLDEQKRHNQRMEQIGKKGSGLYLRKNPKGGVFMRDALPLYPKKNESAVVNLDDSTNYGTHWVCYAKRGNQVKYYDSFGDLRPPLEIIRYMGKNCQIYYNVHPEQKFNESSCGRYCLKFLYNIKQ